MTSPEHEPATVSDTLPIWFQRGESLAIAVLAAVTFVEVGHQWWWLLVLFLVFDLSMIGYAVSSAIGAWTYNAGHTYLAPAALGMIALLTEYRGPASSPSPGHFTSQWTAAWGTA